MSTTRRKLVVAAAAVVLVGSLVSFGVIRWAGSGDDTGGPGPGWPTAPQPTGPDGSATASGVPMPVGNLPGWRQVFTDDFAGTELDESKWFAYEGQPAGDPGGYFHPSHVSVRDGRLVIGAWPEEEQDGLYVTGGISNRNAFSQTYGRFDIRFRAQQGTGIAYALLLWTSANDPLPEVDIAEDNGKDRRTIYGVLHPADPDADAKEFTVEADATQWHTVGLEWTPERLVYTLDGEEWATVDGPEVPEVPMGLALQTQAWYCGHSWEACPDETTPDRVDLEIDWVTIYAHDP